jgi:glycosyltransferase involved in cell wall biosynthesis
MASGDARILHILWSLSIGGAERALYQLVAEQRRRGRVADVLVASDGGMYAEMARADGAAVHELNQRHPFDLRAARQAMRLFRSYDIVHFHSAEVSLAVLSSRSGASVFYTHRAGSFAYPPKQRLRYRAFGRYARRHFRAVSGNTRHAAETATRLFALPEPASVTYNGLDFSLLSPRRSAQAVRAELEIRDDAVVFGTSANLREWKRVDRVVRASTELTGNEVVLIVGDGPAKADLQRLAADLATGDRVIFVPKTAHIADYLQIMSGFVLASGPEESFGNSVVEAMALGIAPVIFSDGGGMTEHVRHGDTGLVVDRPDGLGGALQQLARSSAERERLGESAQRYVRTTYTLDAMFDSYESLYGAA